MTNIRQDNKQMYKYIHVNIEDLNICMYKKHTLAKHIWSSKELNVYACLCVLRYHCICKQRSLCTCIYVSAPELFVS